MAVLVVFPRELIIQRLSWQERLGCAFWWWWEHVGTFSGTLSYPSRPGCRVFCPSKLPHGMCQICLHIRGQNLLLECQTRTGYRYKVRFGPGLCSNNYCMQDWTPNLQRLIRKADNCLKDECWTCSCSKVFQGLSLSVAIFRCPSPWLALRRAAMAEGKVSWVEDGLNGFIVHVIPSFFLI